MNNFLTYTYINKFKLGFIIINIIGTYKTIGFYKYNPSKSASKGKITKLTNVI